VTELFTLTPLLPLLTTQLELPLLTMMLVVPPGAPFPMAFVELMHGSSSNAGWASADVGVKRPTVAAAAIIPASSQCTCRRDPVMSSPLQIQGADPSANSMPGPPALYRGFRNSLSNLVEATNDLDDCNTAQESVAVG
jgi:hypothetical protein